MTDHHNHSEDDDFVLPEENRQWHLRIYDQEIDRADFDAVTLTLDATLHSDLNWKNTIEKAQALIDQGVKVLWNLDCGLFADLLHPITHQSQFLSLALSLEHFRDTIWKKFQTNTVGVCLFQGDADFSQNFRWDEQQTQNYQSWLKDYQLSDQIESRQLFCRDVCGDYLSLLAARLPDTVSIFLLLDATHLKQPLKLLNPEKFERFQLALKGCSLPFQAYGWQTASTWGFLGSVPQEIPSLSTATTGLCIPSNDYQTNQKENFLEQALIATQKKGHAVRLMAENHLTAQWDGLNEIIYDANNLSFQGKRRLQGFCAAGGIVISTGQKNGFSQELTLEDWLKTI